MSSPGKTTAPRHSPRRWLRFSIRTLLIAILLVSLPLAFVAMRIRGGQLQHEVAARVAVLDGTVVYDYHLNDLGVVDVDREPSEPRWMRKMFGDSYGSNVVAVNLHECEGVDDDLKGFSHLVQLAALDLGCTKITNQGLARLASLHNLETLDLHGTQITDRGLKHLSEMSQLTKLDLAGTKITDDGLARLAPLTALTDLRLTSTHISDRGLEHLANLPALEHLYLAGTPITDDGLNHLSALLNLKSVNLHQTQVSDTGTQLLAERLPDVTIFGLERRERRSRYETGDYQRISKCEEYNVYRMGATAVDSKWANAMRDAAQQLRDQAVRIAAMKTLAPADPERDVLIRRAHRWEFEFDTSDPDDYAEKLDGLNIALGVMEAGDDRCEVFFTDFTTFVPSIGYGDDMDDHVLIPVGSGPLANLSKRLIGRADVDIDALEKMEEVTMKIVLCVPPDLQDTLAQLELQASARTIGMTVFGVRKISAGEFQPFVLEQLILPDEFPLE